MRLVDTARSWITTLPNRALFGYLAAAVFVVLSASRDVQLYEQYLQVPVSLALLTTFLVPFLIGCGFQLLPSSTKDVDTSPYDEQTFRATSILNISTLIGWYATISSLKNLPPPIVAAIATGFLPVSTTIFDICTRSRHRFVPTDLFGSLMVLAGVALLVFSGYEYQFTDWMPMALAFVIPIAGAVSNVKIRQLNEMGVSTRSVYSSRFWVLILTALVAGVFQDLQVLTISTASSLVLLGFVGVSVPLYFIQVAVQKLGSQRAASMTGLTAVAAFLLSETSDLSAVYLWLGALLVPAGIYLGAAIPTAAVVDAFSSGTMLAPELVRRGFRCIHIESANNLNPYLAADKDLSYFSHQIDAKKCINPFDIPSMLKSEGVQVVIAGAESGVSLADHLSEALSLPTNGSRLSAARRNKFEMIEVLKKNGLMVTEHCKTADVEQAREWAIERFHKGHNVIVKPLSSAAADNVHLCSTVAEVVTAFDKVRREPDLFGHKNIDVLLERYLRGEEYVVNTVSHDGTHFVTDMWHKSPRRIHGTSLVNDYDELMAAQGPLQMQLGGYVKKALEALEITYGPAHAELKMTPDGPVLIEIAARLVGAGLPKICKICTGSSPVSLVVDAYMNGNEFRRKTKIDYQLRLHGRVVFLISGSSGPWPDDAKETLLEELKKLPSFNGGDFTHSDQTSPTIDLLSCPGIFFLAASTDQELVEDYDAIRAMEAENIYGIDSDDPKGFGEFDRENRAKHFSHAVAECPSARENEVNKMLQLIAAEEGERLVDFGAGNGLLTRRLAPAVGERGEVVAIDSSITAMKLLKENLRNVAQIQRRPWRHESLPLGTETVDGIVSLANLHHVKYKEELFRELFRVLTPGGRLVVGDVADNTAVQRYFDGPVNEFCSTGTPAPVP